MLLVRMGPNLKILVANLNLTEEMSMPSPFSKWNSSPRDCGVQGNETWLLGTLSLPSIILRDAHTFSPPHTHIPLSHLFTCLFPLRVYPHATSHTMTPFTHIQYTWYTCLHRYTNALCFTALHAALFHIYPYLSTCPSTESKFFFLFAPVFLILCTQLFSDLFNSTTHTCPHH